jgi:MinD-like ATPase involved in chromosome partitioning or flagellar assembly
VSDPENIVHKRKENTISLVLCLGIYLSLTKDGVTSIEDLDFDLKFEKTLFRTKSESCLNEIIFDEKRFQDLILATSTKPLVIPTQNQ